MLARSIVRMLALASDLRLTPPPPAAEGPSWRALYLLPTVPRATAASACQPCLG
jgi:hypothetical protein